MFRDFPNQVMIYIFIWSVGTLVTARAMFRNMVRRQYGGLGWDEVILAAVSSLSLCVFFWPLALLRFIGSDPETFARRVGGESKSEKIKRLESEKRDQVFEIQRLERETRV